ncbi:MAG: helix-turn-helix domain-containing protein [Thermoguttaceae bacterium]|nr:helix-turn-helix domain-containing protein [Thermoguttaceae bacterium]
MHSDPTCLPKLLLSAREAAKAMAVCEKTLWSNTQPRGTIPCVRIGARVLYAVDDLRAWIEEQKGGAA